MNREETIRKLIASLRERRLVLRQIIGGFEQSLSVDGDGDVIDRATMNEQLEVYSKLAEAESQELKLIGAALQSYKKRKYGVCESCKRKIPLARLRALPCATQCIQCKQRLESGTSDSAFPHIDMQNGNSLGDVTV